MIQDQDIKSEHWWAGTDSHKQCGEDSKMVRETYVAYGGQTERKVVKNWSMKKKREGGEKYGTPEREGRETVHSKLWLHSRLSVFFFFLPPDWLDPRAAFSLPDPNFPHFSHHGINWCLQVAEKRERRALYMCHLSFFNCPHRSDRKLACTSSPAWEGQPGFFPSTAPELLWKSLSGNSTHFFFFVPVEVGRDWKHSLWDNRLSKSPMTTPCSSQTWMSQQQVTQQLLQWFH